MMGLEMIEAILSANRRILIFAKDKNLKYIFCNDAMAEAAGLDSPAQIAGKTDHDLIWSRYGDLYQENNKKVFQGIPQLNEKLPFSSIFEKKLNVLSCTTILRDDNENVIGIAGHAVDITGYSITKNNGKFDVEKNIFYLGPHFSNEYFTKREFEVFKYLLMGKAVSEIALTLSRTIKTIQSQVRSVANKLQCTHQSEIVPTAIKYGLTYILDEIGFEKCV